MLLASDKKPEEKYTLVAKELNNMSKVELQDIARKVNKVFYITFSKLKKDSLLEELKDKFMLVYEVLFNDIEPKKKDKSMKEIEKMKEKYTLLNKLINETIDKQNEIVKELKDSKSGDKKTYLNEILKLQKLNSKLSDKYVTIEKELIDLGIIKENKKK